MIRIPCSFIIIYIIINCVLINIVPQTENSVLNKIFFCKNHVFQINKKQNENILFNQVLKYIIHLCYLTIDI